MGHHRTRAAQPVDHAFQDTLAREGPAIAVTPAVSRQQTALHVRRAPLASSGAMGRANLALLAPSRTVPAVLATHVLLAVPDQTARVLFVRTGHHRTPGLRLAYRVVRDFLAHEGLARVVVPALGRQRTLLHVSLAQLGPLEQMGPANRVLRAPSRTVQAVLATHVVLALPAPVVFAQCARPDLNRMRCLLRARHALRVRPERLVSALLVM